MPSASVDVDASNEAVRSLAVDVNAAVGAWLAGVTTGAVTWTVPSFFAETRPLSSATVSDTVYVPAAA
ncbi:hypothetical protein BC477_17195 [Clavibacter michiganensis subsp. michiganensis]|uniref:Uncharacterized protein n=1 Tax=Clavibacter michiganensis subsp. michiganensis TaxID=33013 RepID=A0A251XDR8_CLAMM|nr:hypothetical protein BC477_17195 [Clavibacter michiganensis subsp. michiganensis]OUE00357.1 hypothetical protein CMMCAS07_18305 [Clavibacter michiganensis subsp. michiganensis]